MINQHHSVDNTHSPHKAGGNHFDLPSLKRNTKKIIGLNRSPRNKNSSQHHKSSYISSIQQLTANVEY